MSRPTDGVSQGPPGLCVKEGRQLLLVMDVGAGCRLTQLTEKLYAWLSHGYFEFVLPKSSLWQAWHDCHWL
jgi:hypothetical protein